MIVTVVAVRMMEMALNQIIDVVTMGNRFVSTARTVFVALVMAAADMAGRAPVGILWADIYCMLFDEC